MLNSSKTIINRQITIGIFLNSKVKSLGESDDFDDINAWIERSREKEKSKADAERRAKMLEEMDAEFGVDDLVKENIKMSKKLMYSDRHLKGLKVDHAVDAFDDGKTVILTLKDHAVLDEDEDALINVNMVDNERYKKVSDVAITVFANYFFILVFFY